MRFPTIDHRSVKPRARTTSAAALAAALLLLASACTDNNGSSGSDTADAAYGTHLRIAKLQRAGRSIQRDAAAIAAIATVVERSVAAIATIGDNDYATGGNIHIATMGLQ